MPANLAPTRLPPPGPPPVLKRPDAKPTMMPARPATAAPARGTATLIGIAARRNQPTFREQLFERWLATADRGHGFVYHRGELGLDAAQDPAIAAIARAVREASTGSFAEVSRCGHERGRTIGSGEVELVTRRERGETVYIARKR